MRKQQHERKTHFYRLAFSDETNDQILKAHKQGKMSFLRPCQFIRQLVNMGLEEYKFMYELERRTSDYDAPHYVTKTDAKIIQFPFREAGKQA